MPQDVRRRLNRILPKAVHADREPASSASHECATRFVLGCAVHTSRLRFGDRECRVLWGHRFSIYGELSIGPICDAGHMSERKRFCSLQLCTESVEIIRELHG
jgi:hypothetical protein